MDRRLDLEKLSFKELQTEVRKNGLKPSNSRDGCIDQLMNFFESSVQTHYQESTPSVNQQETQLAVSNTVTPDLQESSSASSNQVTSFPVTNTNYPDLPINQSEDSACPPASQALPFSNDASKSAQIDSISLLCSLVSDQMKQHQQMMQLLSSFASSHFTQQDQSRASFPPQESHRLNSGGSDLSASTKISVNTVNLLASQLPEFSGKEEDDVEI